MRGMRIRTNWAAASILDDGRVMVCARHNGATHCGRFASAEALRQALEKGSLSVRRWVLAIPKDLCITKRLSLPTEDFSEATTMVEFEITSLVPLPRDAMSYGTTLVGRGEHVSHVLVWILRHETLEHYLQPYRAMGIEPKALIPDVVAIHHWFTSATSHKTGPALYVLADQARVLVLTDVENTLQALLEMPVSREDADASARAISQEILRLQQELAPGSLDKSILLAGEEPSVTRIQEQLHRLVQDQAAPISLHVLASPPVVGSPPDSDDVRDDAGGCCQAAVVAGLMGLFTASVPRHLNLLPQAYLQRQEKRLALLRRVQRAAVCVLLVLLTWACLAAANWRLAKRARLIESQIAPIKQIAGAVESKRQRVRAIQQQLAHRELISRTVQELYEYTPQQISFSELKLSYHQGTLSLDLKGQADMLSTAFEYTEAVRQAQLVRGIQIVNAQQVPQPRGGSVVDFGASCTIRGE